MERELPTERREIQQEASPDESRRLQTGRPLITPSRDYAPVVQQTVVLEPVVRERVRVRVIEEIQPVLFDQGDD
jgi:hypothetical protein